MKRINKQKTLDGIIKELDFLIKDVKIEWDYCIWGTFVKTSDDVKRKKYKLHFDSFAEITPHSKKGICPILQFHNSRKKTKTLSFITFEDSYDKN